MLSAEHPLCGVNGVFNGIFVHGNVLGDAMFYGSGAGKLPTASAVVADIVDMTKHKNTNIYFDFKGCSCGRFTGDGDYSHQPSEQRKGVESRWHYFI